MQKSLLASAIEGANASLLRSVCRGHSHNSMYDELSSKSKKMRFFRVVQKIVQNDPYFFDTRLVCEESDHLVGYASYIVEIKK